MSKRLRRMVLSAAISAVPAIFTTQATGQYRVNNGNALDASNRLGSGGYNDAPSRAVASGNQIVTRNSTGLSYFHGAVQYTDPNEFRGHNPANSMDRFLARSAGTPTPDNRDPVSLYNPSPFY